MTNTFELKTNDSESVKDLQRIYYLDAGEIVEVNTRDLIVFDHFVSRKDGAEFLPFVCNLFRLEIFAREINAVRFAVRRNDKQVMDERNQLLRTVKAGEILHRKLSRLEESNAPLLKPSSNKPVESLAGIRY